MTHPDDMPSEYELILGPFLSSIRMEIDGDHQSQFDKDAQRLKDKIAHELVRRRKYLLMYSAITSLAVGVLVGLVTSLTVYLTIHHTSIVIGP